MGCNAALLKATVPVPMAPATLPLLSDTTAPAPNTQIISWKPIITLFPFKTNVSKTFFPCYRTNTYPGVPREVPPRVDFTSKPMASLVFSSTRRGPSTTPGWEPLL